MSRRFLTGRRGGRGRLVFLFSVFLIGAGVAALNTILAVMNGLQRSYIRSILEIGSYHLRWTPDSHIGEEEFSEAARLISADPAIRLATRFREGQAMLQGDRPGPVGALIRGVAPDIYEADPALASRLDIIAGVFDVENSGIVIGDDLALSLGLSPGEKLRLLNFRPGGLEPSEIVLEVRGLFQCGYRQYESGLAFVSLETSALFLSDAPMEIGIKLKRAESDRIITARLTRPAGPGQPSPLESGELRSWRDANRAFFGALRTEKVMMLLLLTLIFVVVAVNIDHSLRRMAAERAEDFSILKALGASPRDIRILFWRHGLFIGGTGGLCGSLLGVFIGDNVGLIAALIGRISRNPAAQYVETFAGSSEVMVQDVVIILALAVFLSSLAALRAASAAALSRPAEVLRSE